MASLPSSLSSSTFRFRVKPVNAPLLLHQPCIVSYAASQRASSKAPRKLVVAQFRMPDEAKMQMNAVKEQLWKSLPESIKELPWKKAGDLLLKLLLSRSKEAFKWSFIAWFFLSFPSDILFAISRNQELMMPFGLFAGCFLADFMRETSEELFQQAQVKNWNLMGIACVFVMLKLVSVLFGVRGQVFLQHMANGGLMQILWLLWKQYQGDDVKNVDSA